MFRSIFLAVVLFLLWLVLSGIYTPILIAFGVLSSIIVAWIAYRMDVADHEGFPIQLSWKAISYWPWLIIEIIKSNKDEGMCYLILTFQKEFKLPLSNLYIICNNVTISKKIPSLNNKQAQMILKKDEKLYKLITNPESEIFIR